MTKLPPLAIMLFIGLSAFSQTQTEKEVKSLLVHKWKATHLEEPGGQKIPVPTEMGDWFLDFKADGKIIMIDDSHKEEKGKWNYDHKTKILTVTSEKEPQKFQIRKVTGTELVIEAPEDGVMYLKRVN